MDLQLCPSQRHICALGGAGCFYAIQVWGGSKESRQEEGWLGVSGQLDLKCSREEGGMERKKNETHKGVKDLYSFLPLKVS